MRWVWRAEAGVGKVEYGALVVLAAAIVAALIAVGLPTDVSAGVRSALCVMWNDPSCDAPKNEGATGEPKNEDTASDPPKGGGGGTGGGTGDEPQRLAPDTGGSPPPSPSPSPAAEWTEADQKVYEDAKGVYDQAHEDYNAANNQLAGIDEELLLLLADLLIPREEIEKCLTEGDVGACVMALVDLVPWGKIKKLVEKIPDAYRIFRRYLDARGAREAAKRRIGETEQPYLDLKNKKNRKEQEDEAERKRKCPTTADKGGAKPVGFRLGQAPSEQAPPGTRGRAVAVVAATGGSDGLAVGTGRLSLLGGGNVPGFVRIDDPDDCKASAPTGSSIRNEWQNLRSGKQKHVKEVDSEEELDSLFKSWTKGGTKVENPNYPGEMYDLPDGTRIMKRNKSKSGGSTIDIKIPGESKQIKVHIEP